MLSIPELNKLARALGGVPVLGCLPGSPSHRAGVRYGDIVLETNGHKTSSLDAYLEARGHNPQSMTLVVFRDGVERTLDLDLTRYRASEEQLRTYVEETGVFAGLAVDPGARGVGDETC